MYWKNDVFDFRKWNVEWSLLEDRPWGMLLPREGNLLYVLARDYYSGAGEIVDAGAFIGASAFCLARGLEENTTITTPSGRIHSFDLFEVWTELGGTHDEMAARLEKDFGVPVGHNETFVHIYSRNLGDLCRHVRIHAGDIRKETWPGRPIEILFVDIFKDLSIQKHAIGMFYRSLIPGISLLIHQDYHHPLLPWIHVVQARLSPWFEVVVEAADSSRVWRLKDRIPDRVLDEVAAYDYSPEAQIKLMDEAIDEISSPHSRGHLQTAKSVLLHRLGWQADARNLLASIDPGDDRLLKDNIGAAHWALSH